MKKSILIMLAGFSPMALAHHTRDHLMLSEGADKVIAATQGGSGGPLWLIWLAVIIALLLGLVRWWRGGHLS